jgi:hypothetical protein
VSINVNRASDRLDLADPATVVLILGGADIGAGGAAPVGSALLYQP